VCLAQAGEQQAEAGEREHGGEHEGGARNGGDASATLPLAFSATDPFEHFSGSRPCRCGVDQLLMRVAGSASRVSLRSYKPWTPRFKAKH
jgi:hypothetical protein